jgi:hypothetical protein
LVVIDPASGRARPLAWVTIYPSNTLTLAPLYADDDVSAIANPVQANELGQVAVRVNPGTYDVSMTWDGAQPTVVEDVLAWTPEAAVLTTPGDLLVGSPAGGTVRLPVGGENQILVVDGGMPKWVYLASSDGVPGALAGSIPVYSNTTSTGAGPAIMAISPGTQDQALAMAGGMPTWVSTLIPPGTTLPINQPGDLVIGAVGTGLPARLPVGTEGQLLSVVAPGSINWVAPGVLSRGAGQGVLRLEGGLLKFQAEQGNQLWIETASRTIPAAGITLAPTGLSLNTNYYIYAAWVSGAMQLAASPTGWTNDAGYYYKQGDGRYALVGLARVVDDGAGAPKWVDSPRFRCVVSFFNPKGLEGGAFLPSPRTITATTMVEISPDLRCVFLSLGNRGAIVGINGTAYPTVAATLFISYVWFDGAPVSGTAGAATGALLSHINIHTSVAKSTVNEGLHELSMYGVVSSGGGATWHGTSDGLEACRTYFLVSG